MTESIKIITPQRKRKIPKKPTHPPIPLRIMQFVFGTIGRVFPKLFTNVALRFFTTPRRRAKHKISDSILEQAVISDLLLGSYMIKIYEWGSGDKTILLVHGWESRGTALRSFIPDLLEKGFRVVAFDGPAHGNSSGKRVDLPTFALAIKALVEKHKNITGIVAHSFGGIASTYAMLNYVPDYEFERLVLVGSPSKFDYPLKNALRTMNAPPKVRKYFLAKFEKMVGRPIDNIGIGDVSDDLNVQQVLVVHDKQDEMVAFSQAELTVKNWSRAELQPTDGFGHFSLMKSPEVVERVVEFMK